MPLAIRKGGLCAFCSFRTSQSIRHSLNRPNGLRYRSTFGVQSIRRVAKRGETSTLARRDRDYAGRVRDTGLVESNETTFGVFGRLLLEQTHRLEFTLRYKERVSVKAWGIKTDEELDEKLAFFKGKLKACTDRAEEGKVNRHNNPLFHRMRNAFITGGMSALASEMKFAFINEVATVNFTPHHQANQEKLADLRYPLEWYPATRALQRTVHLHVGPTNSGKTYHALQRLEAAQSGIYAGPLRLLAHEVYTRLNAKGIPCALVTGEERRIPEDYNHTMNSCTVEMVPLNAKVDVAVIDEIQMMGDTERGWAWTQAFLGVQAKEVHLCGETRTKKIITDLCAAMGDKLVIHEYERLSPLKTQSHSLGRLGNLEKGDAIILFSRVAIHAMKSDVERVTGKRCAVVYGSLPPETRAQQAALFNDPNNDYDFLVASDAVGMGLNLSIKRVIFESTSKHDGISFRTMQPYKTAQEAIDKGNLDDAKPLALDAVKKQDRSMGYQAMEMEVEPLASVGIFPPADILHRFASYFPPKTPFGYIFHLCRLKEQIQIVDLVQEFDMSHMDRITLMSSPANLRDPGMTKVIKEMAQCIAEQKTGALLDMNCFDLELIDKDIHDDVEGSKGYLRKAEALHRAVTLYLWLSYRFAGIFTNQALAFHVKTLIEEKIDQCLEEVSWTEAQRKKLNYMRIKAAKAAAKENELAKAAALSLESDDTSPIEDSGISFDSSSGVRGADMEPGNEDQGDLIDDLKSDLEEEEDADSNEEEALELKAVKMEVMEQEGHDSEDSPASDGNIPTTPEDLEIETGDAYKAVAQPVREIETRLLYDMENAASSEPLPDSATPLTTTEFDADNAKAEATGSHS
ncbi:hypothetical protein BKA61DRAFT_626233 [Leptodontidium sp. MPI-SDFR-AT-0119]|nr:hypothetical protein BKA61DRAFT_626233 [Leptodontidium sp. MPI-SDFR-AT-0119]